MSGTTMTVVLRPSAANLYAKCVAAAHGQQDDFKIHWEDGAGNVGSALHAAAQALVLREPVRWEEIVRRFALTISEQRDLRMLIACVRKYCDEQLHAGGWSRTFITEQRVEGCFETARAVYDLGGKMDVGGFSADGTIWGTVDWKTTRLENADYAPQQIIYLWLMSRWVMANLPPKKWPTHYQYHIVFVRDWTEEISEAYTVEQLQSWLAGFLDQIEAWNGREYRPGGHCLYCPRQADCPAIYRLVMAMARAVADPQLADTAERADGDAVVSFYVQANAVAGLIENAKLLLKALVVGRGGEIASPDGVLTTIHRPTYVIDPLQAWPLCTAVLTEQELADATRLSKIDLLDGVAHHHPRGQKGKAKEDFWDRLCESGAVEQKDSLVLALKKAKTPTETTLRESANVTG